jgi:hypothetical protein
VSACRSCGAPIWWAFTGAGKRIPVDVEPTPDGNLFAVGDGIGDGETPVVAVITSSRQPFPDALRYTSHFATCPNASAHRRR